jgi:hypothetical protein
VAVRRPLGAEHPHRRKRQLLSLASVHVAAHQDAFRKLHLSHPVPVAGEGYVVRRDAPSVGNKLLCSRVGTH